MRNYTVKQAAVGLLYSALPLVVYMYEKHGLFPQVNGQLQLPKWMEAFDDTGEVTFDESFELGLGARELETWVDDFILADFPPIAEQLPTQATQPNRNLAFVAMALAFIVNTFLETTHTSSSVAAVRLLESLKEYLRVEWKTDLDHGEINEDLVAIYEPLARAVSEKWQEKLATLTQTTKAS